MKTPLPFPFIALLATLALSAPAAPKSWDGGGGADHSWHNPLNWSGDSLPAPADDVTLAQGSIVLTNGSVIVNSVIATVPFTLSGGSLSVSSQSRFTSNFDFLGGTVSGPVYVKGGTLFVGPGVTAPSTIRAGDDDSHLLGNLSPVVTIWVHGGPFSHATLTATGGVINAGTIRLEGDGGYWSQLAVTGGTFTNTATGLIEARPGTTATAYLNGNLHNLGTVTVQSNVVLKMESGTFTQAGGSLSALGRFQHDAGRFDFLGGGVNGQTYVSGADLWVAPTVSAPSTIRAGDGDSHLLGNLSTAVTIWVHGGPFSHATLTATGGVINAGTLRLEGDGGYWSQLAVTGGTFTNTATGLIEARPGTTGAAYLVGSLFNLGSLAIEQGVTFQCSVMDLTNAPNGRITGSGIMALSGVGLFNSGIVSPGGVGAAGVLRIDGPFHQSAAGRVEVELGGLAVGTQHDQLLLNAPAALDGELRVTLLGDFVPVLSNSFRVVTFASLGGQFSSYDGLNIATDRSLEPVYSATALDLRTVGATNQLVSPPVIVVNPANLTVVHGQSATFRVTANGTRPFGYQWQFNGANISDATNAAFTLSPALTNDAGAYRVVIRNSAGTNTSASATLTVRTIADLVIADVLSTNQAASGQPVVVSWTTRNQGSQPALGLWRETVLLATNASGAGATTLATFTVTNIVFPGQSLARTQSVIAPGGLEGAYYFVVQADSADEIVEEFGETNNVTVATNAIVLHSPDLRVSLLTSAATGVFGQPLAVAWVVTNAGTAPALLNWRDRLYLATNAARLGTVNALVTQPAPAAPLAAGASVTNSATVTLPLNATLPPGSYFLIVAADVDNAVAESRETNNLASRAITLALPPLPDLVAANVSSRTTVLPGQTVPIVWTTTNAGSAAATGRWAETILLRSADGSSAAFSRLEFTNTLPVGGSLLRTREVTIPFSGPAGTLVFAVEVDSFNDIVENNETNNLTTATNTTLIPAALTLSLPGPQLSEGTSLRATLTRNGSLAQPLTVTVTNSDVSEVSFDQSLLTSAATIVIPAGQPSADFTMRALADGIPDGPQSVEILASASGYQSAFTTLTVLDVDVPRLALTLATNAVVEGQTVAATVARQGSTNAPLVVQLVTSSSAQLVAPASVIIPAGASSWTFALLAADDTLVESSASYTVSASASGTTSDTATVTILDNDVPLVTLAFAPRTVSEGAGSQATVGTLTRASAAPRAVTVELLNSDTNAVLVPRQVIIPAFESSAIFAVAAVNNASNDPPRQVAVGGYVLASGTTTRLTQIAPDMLTVTDDDGPALSVVIARDLVAEALNPATTATVTRNTPATNDLVITLITSDTNEVVIGAPAVHFPLPLGGGEGQGEGAAAYTLTVPSGQTTATFNLVTVNDGTNDGSKTVIITASAAGYTSGSDRVVVSDVNLPDLVVSDVTAPPTADTETFVNLGYRLRNDGLAAMPSNAIVQRIFLSRDPLLGDDTLMLQFTNRLPLPVGDAFAQTFQLRLPQAPGDYWVVVQADVDNAVPEALEDNNTAISTTPMHVAMAYDATVATTLSTAPANTPVPLTGRAFKPGTGGPAAFALVNIHLKVRGTHRVISALADAQGNFSTVWQPLPNEAGFYEIAATHPGVAEADPQDTFTLLGMKARPATPAVTLAEQSTVAGTFDVCNLSDLPLTGLNVTVANKPSNLDVTVSLSQLVTNEPLNSLPGLGTNRLNYVITARNATLPQGTVLLRVTSAEGATLDLPVAVTVNELRARLVTVPAELVQGMKRGAQRLVEFEIANLGGAASGPLSVSLPDVPWMHLALANPLPSLAPGQTNKVTLQLMPPDDLELTTYHGHLAVNGTTAGVSVPFAFRALSEAKGDLRIVAVDEYTYYAEGSPRVTNATIVLRDPLTQVIVTNAVSDTNGEFVVRNMMEAYYIIEVSAERHSAYRSNVLLVAGRTNEVLAFVSRQTVQYTWSVTPTEIEDRTRITVETTFETVVPIPVVTLDPPLIDLRDLDVDVLQVDLTVVNHGLIAAEQASFHFAEDPEYEVTPLIQDVGLLPARSSLTVPLTIRKKPSGGFHPASAGGSGACIIEGGLRWSLYCGERQDYYVPTRILPKRDCEAGGAYVPPRGVPGGASGGNCFVCGFGLISPRTSVEWPGFCDPCVQKRLKAIQECVEKFVPCGEACWYKCLKDSHQCVEGVSSGHWSAAYGCFKAALNCSKAAGSSLPPWWPGNTIKVVECTYEIVTACDGLPGHGSGGGGPFVPAGDSPSPGIGNSEVGRLRLLADQLEKFIEPTVYLFNDRIWFQGEEGTTYIAWLEAFLARIEPATFGGESVSTSERSELLALSLPLGVTPADVNRFLDRWNRSLAYWQAGIFRASDVPSGQSTDFIDIGVWTVLAGTALAAQASSTADGFEDPAQAVFAEVLALENSLEQGRGGGVCARVRLRLEQEAVLTRDAFNATLEIENNTAGSLEMIGVDIKIENRSGQETTLLFGIRTPALSGMGAVDGSGTIAPNSNGRASWTIIPTAEAAPNEVTEHIVSGVLRYKQDDVQITIRLAPTVIRVLPTPLLSLKYFHQRDVFSDDPFTDAIEPSVPFSLAVMVHNQGAGVARNFRITSAQPQIIDNEKGLLADFRIIATEVAGRNLVPSLTAEFGTIDPGQIAIGRWLLTSTIQGLFIDYTATFEHIDGLGNQRLSLIDEVSIHELIHLVQAGGPFEDGKPDFLVNELPDLHDDPDTLYLSDGRTNPVAVVTHGVADAPPSAGDLQVQFTAPMPPGWACLRVPDPANGTLRLAGVVRSDGAVIAMNTNVWTTDRTFIGLGRRPVRENILHLLDYNSTGSYTLIYEPNPGLDVTPPSSAVAALPPDSRANVPVRWSGQDNAGGSGINFYDIYVSENGGGFRRWIWETLDTSAVYQGSFGKTYAFYSIAVDQAGNREAPPSTPDAQTTVTRTNHAPTLAAVGDVTITEGDTLLVWLQASDPDGDSLSFNLVAGAPPGVVLNGQNGQLSWVTGEGNGPGTNVITVIVLDNGAPRLGASISFRITVNEGNTPPILAAFARRTINEGRLLTVTAMAEDFDLPRQALTFGLGAGAPFGAAIDPATGDFTWRPGETNGGKTNLIAIIVRDSGVPSASATQFLEVVVRDVLPDFTLRVGSTSVLAGASGQVPIELATGQELTSIRLNLDLPVAGLTGVVLEPLATEIESATLLPTSSNRFLVTLQTKPAQELFGSGTPALLRFNTASNAPSVIVPLQVSGVEGTTPGGVTLTGARGTGGRVFVIGESPLLDALRTTNGTRELVLYGHPGEAYEIQSTTNLNTPSVWQPVREMELTGTFDTWTGLPTANAQVYYRAMQLASPSVNRIGGVTWLRDGLLDGHLQFQFPGVAGRSYVIEGSTNLIHWQVIGTNTAPVSFTAPAGVTAPHRFFRLKSGP